MKIIKLTAENVKRLKAVEITPDGEVVLITGKNGQGKTSVLDAIWFALGGERTQKDTPEPIRKGAKEARVILDLGDMTVTRNWTSNDKSYLKIENAAGQQQKSPQALLDSLVGRLTFDPLEFARMEAKEQARTLAELAKIDLNQFEAKRKELYDQRTIVNREIRRLETNMVDTMQIDSKLPDKEISVNDVMAEYQAATDTMAANNANRRKLKDLGSRFIEKKEAIEELRARLSEMEKEYEGIRAEGKTLKAEVEALVDPDVEALKTKLSQVEEINKKVREQKRYLEAKAAHDKASKENGELTRAMEAIDAEKEAAIKSAPLPVEGLSFDESGVLFNGLPFAQASDAERLRISLAMAMALNPSIRVIRVRDGSLLDSASLKLVEEMAREKDYQVWIEYVDESGEIGVYIEEGAVVKVNSKPKEQPATREPDIPPVQRGRSRIDQAEEVVFE